MSLLYPLIGGSAIGIASVNLLLSSAKILGVSGILKPFWTQPKTLFSDSLWKLLFVSSVLGLSPLFDLALREAGITTGSSSWKQPSFVEQAIAGFLVGFGTCLGNGCTSGHGVGGLGRKSKRSFASVLSFCASGILTASLSSLWRTSSSSSSSDTHPVPGLVLALAPIPFALYGLYRHSKTDNSTVKMAMPPLLSGALFTFGLQISGMSDPKKVIGFLNLNVGSFDDWDYSLALVLFSAVGFSLAGYEYLKRKDIKAPLLCPKTNEECDFSGIPTNQDIDKKLIIGAVIFGVGWGLGGVCPGPALVLLSLGKDYAMFGWFPSFVLGNWVHYYIFKVNRQANYNSSCDSASLDKAAPLLPTADPTLPDTHSIMVGGFDVKTGVLDRAQSWLEVIPNPNPPKKESTIVNVLDRGYNEDTAHACFKALDELPRPTLVTCRAGNNATAVARLYNARNLGLSGKDVISAGLSAGEKWTENTKLVNWVQEALSDSERGIVFKQMWDPKSSTYTYLVGDKSTGLAVLIDPVDTQVKRDLKAASVAGLTVKYGVNTHAHADHITGTALLRQMQPSLKSVISEASGAVADIKLKDGDKIVFGKRYLTALSTPGHTNGCMSFVLDNESMVFTGDALLINGCGRTDFQEGSNSTLYNSVVSRLFTLPGKTRVFPGHDYKGRTCSTIEEQRLNNSRLGGGKTEKEFDEIMKNLKLGLPKMIDIAVPKNMMCGV